MRMGRKWIFMAPLAMLAAALFAFAGGEVVRLLWNWLTPELFGWREITFWQALGLLVLCRILFGGFGRHGVRRSHRSPEERERFRQGMRKHFGFDSPPVETREI